VLLSPHADLLLSSRRRVTVGVRMTTELSAETERFRHVHCQLRLAELRHSSALSCRGPGDPANVVGKGALDFGEE
jgi:hypothetical protein